MNTPIVPSEFLEDLGALLSRHLKDADLKVVPSVKEWCESRHVSVRSPFQCGAVLRSRETGRFLVLLPEQITAEMHASRVTVLRMRPSLTESRLKVLRTQKGFLRHLLLHEIAHALDDTRTEEQCDNWAFQQLELPHAA